MSGDGGAAPPRANGGLGKAREDLFDDRDQEQLMRLAQIVVANPRAISDEVASELQLLVIKALDELSETRETLAALTRYRFAVEGVTT